MTIILSLCSLQLFKATVFIQTCAKKIMDTSSKNRLQEYCLKNKFLLPNYRVINQSGLQHSLRFQVSVSYNQKYFILTSRE